MKDSFNVSVKIDGNNTTLMIPDYLLKEELSDVKATLRQIFQDRETNAEAINRIQKYLASVRETYKTDAEVSKNAVDLGMKGAARRVSREAYRDSLKIESLYKYMNYLSKEI